MTAQEDFVDEQRMKSWQPLRIREEQFPNLTTAKDFDMATTREIQEQAREAEAQVRAIVPAEIIDDIIGDYEQEDTQAQMPDPHTHYQLPEVAKNIAKASDNLKDAAGIFQRATQKSQEADSAMQSAKAHYDDRKATMAAWMKEMEDFTS